MDTGEHRAGVVTRLGTAPEPVLDPFAPEPPPSPADVRRQQRRTLMLFGGSAIGVVVIGIVVLVLVAFGGAENPFRRPTALPDNRPPLARLCPPPTGAPSAAPAQPAPEPSGPRTRDPEAGISYKRYGEPWIAWKDVWTAGTLRVAYKTGQHFVTEVYPGGTYHASILSASVPATVNDAVMIDLACTGRQVAADVRAEYYPQPNRMELMRDEQTELGGRPAWVTKFRLHFEETGLKADSELVLVALIDVGRPDAAILYVSVPNTHQQFDWVVDDVLASVRVD